MGVAGLLFAPFCLRRAFAIPVTEHRRSGGVGRRGLRADRAQAEFWLIALRGGHRFARMAYGLAFWIPSFLARSFQLGAGRPRADLLASIVLDWRRCRRVAWRRLVGDRLEQARPRLVCEACRRSPMLLSHAGLPAGLSPATRSSPHACPLLLIPTALNIAVAGTGDQRGPTVSFRAHMRATASAMFLLINNLIGLGLGTLVIGTISDALKPNYGDEALRYAAIACTTSALRRLRPLLHVRLPHCDWHRDTESANYLNDREISGSP